VDNNKQSRNEDAAKVEKLDKANTPNNKPEKEVAGKSENPADRQGEGEYVSRLNQAIKESTDPEVQKLKSEIDSIKKERSVLIFKIKDARRGLKRKEIEDATFSKILESQHQSEEENKQARNKISKLKKMKNVLEFKIATEATSLAAEKSLVRKIEEVNAELQQEYKKVRLKRKSELIKRDIEEYKKSIDSLGKEISNYDKKLDDLYAKIKERLGIKKMYKENKRNVKPQFKQKREREQQQPAMNVNLEDIAIIKKKKKEQPANEE